MTSTILEKAKKWLSAPFDHQTRQEVQRLIEQQSPLLEDAFYKDLEFGTGGIRGIMGVGTNRLNPYTLGQATQGLSNYLKKQFPSKKLKVAIAYDVRHNSPEFAAVVRDVLTANGIQVYLYKEHRPTPELSFTVRHLGCHAGIVLTASHNPPEYNGYKVYWNDGAQVVAPHDQGIVEEVRSVDFSAINFKGNPDLVHLLGEEMDDVFIETCIQQAHYAGQGKEALKLVFSAIHGTTYCITPKALERAGFKQVYLVEEQMKPSGDFPTVKSPNPEEPEALKMATDLAEEVGADILFGTDPDGDRLGMAVRNFQGKMQLLNGNQTNLILTDYILHHWKASEKLKPTDFIGSTIVTSDCFIALAEKYGIECKVGLTGFKWIADMIRKSEGTQRFVCGGEESFGFMIGDFVRDKDSVGSILLAGEMASWCKMRGQSVLDYLVAIYREIGFYHEDLVSLVKKGRDGQEQITKMMVDFREHPPQGLGGEKILQIFDYQRQTILDTTSGVSTPIKGMPSSNVLIFYTETQKIAVRPSGTEPKIKFYFSLKSSIQTPADFIAQTQILSEKTERLKQELGVL